MEDRQVPSTLSAVARWVMATSLVAASAMGAGQAFAQAALPGDPFLAPAIAAVPIVPTGFDITGFIQEATLDTKNARCTPTHPRLAGGTVTVNGHKITIPCNTILQMPAFTMTWADMFQTPTSNPLVPTDIVPAYQTGLPPQTGLALNDRISPAPGPGVPNTQPGLLTAPAVGTPYNGALPSYEIHVVGNVVNQEYIAGLVFISQQSVNA